MLLLKRLLRWLEGELDEIGEMEDEEDEEEEDDEEDSDEDVDESESGDDEDGVEEDGFVVAPMGLAIVPRRAELRLVAAWCKLWLWLWLWLFKVDSKDKADCCDGCMAASDAFKLAALRAAALDCDDGNENEEERKYGRRDCG